MDSALEPALCVHRPNGSLMQFLEFSNGLYFFDTATPSSPFSPTVTLVTTVADNLSRFTRREVEGARAARALSKHIGRPSQWAFEYILDNNLLHNCPLTSANARRANIIFGPDSATLKGKTTKGLSMHVPSTLPTGLPTYILQHHQHVTLAMDIFLVQGIAFFHTTARKIQFRTVAAISNRSNSTLLLEAQAIIRLYHTRGFIVTHVHADQEFECIRNELLPVVLNITAADDHVGEAECSIRTIKEWVRATMHGYPYRYIPTVMIKKTLVHNIKCLNPFPAKNGVSETMGPQEIVAGMPKPDYNKLKLEFGSCVQVFEENHPTNTMSTRMIGAIALSHTDNAQSDYFFVSLVTGACISRHQWKVLPISNKVIQRVEAIAKAQGHKQIQGGPLFEWGPNDPISDDPMVKDDDGIDRIAQEEEGADGEDPADVVEDEEEADACGVAPVFDATEDESYDESDLEETSQEDSSEDNMETSEGDVGDDAVADESFAPSDNKKNSQWGRSRSGKHCKH